MAKIPASFAPKEFNVRRQQTDAIKFLSFSFFPPPPVAFFLLTTLGFILFAALSRSGWALGRIISTSILMPEKVSCPPEMTELGPDAKCEASELVIFTSRINYGTCAQIHASIYILLLCMKKKLTSHINSLIFSRALSLSQTPTGLFGDLKYETTSEISIDFRAETPGGVDRTWLEKKNALISSDIQPSYERWYVVCANIYLSMC